MIVNKFKPDRVIPDNNLSALDHFKKVFNKKNIFFSASGKGSIFNILESFKPEVKSIVIPYYLCSSVRDSAINCGYKVFYADIDIDDLNISKSSVIDICQENKIGVVLIPSLYGNPANLEEIIDFCRSKGILTIDDAAQAYGASIKNNFIGSFGNAGLYSFSPGKPLSGYLGGCFWSDFEVIEKTHRFDFFYRLINFAKYYDFKNNRLNIDQNRRILGKASSLLLRLLQYIFSYTYYDFLTKFDLKYICGLVQLNLEYKCAYLERFQDNSKYRVLRPIRGKGVCFKLVLVFFSSDDAKRFSKYLRRKQIYFTNGYDPLCNQFDSFRKINGKLFEVPIDTSSKKREYVYHAIQNYR